MEGSSVEPLGGALSRASDVGPDEGEEDHYGDYLQDQGQQSVPKDRPPSIVSAMDLKTTISRMTPTIPITPETLDSKQKIPPTPLRTFACSKSIYGSE